MAEELIEILEKFELSSKSKIDLGDITQGIGECSRSLIGKVIGERKTNFIGIKKYAESSWGKVKRLKIAEISPNMFQFIF